MSGCASIRSRITRAVKWLSSTIKTLSGWSAIVCPYPIDVASTVCAALVQV